MAHALTVNARGASMAYTGETPWHGLGASMPETSTRKEWMLASQTDCEVYQCPIVGLPDVGEPIPYDGNRMNFAKFSDGTIKPLGIVGPNTDILQNDDAFGFFDTFVEQGHGRWETMGALDEFRKVWAMLRLNENDIIADGDEIARYLMISNSHDGSTAVRVGFTPVRIVCANTLGLAHRSKSSKLIKVSHAKREKTGGLKASVELIVKTIDAANAEFVATAEQFRILASRKNIDKKSLELYTRKVFGMDTECSRMELPPQSRTKIDDIVELFENGKGNRGQTWWHAYNAVTEYVSWFDGRKPETRLEKAWFGTNVAKIDESLSLALQLSA